MTGMSAVEMLLRKHAREGAHVEYWAVGEIDRLRVENAALRERLETVSLSETTLAKEVDRLRAELDHRAEEANAVVDAVTTVEVRG